MAERDVEIVREHIEAFTDDAERSLSFCDTHIVLDRSRIGLESAYGHEALVKAVRSYMGAFHEYGFQVETLRDLGSGLVLAGVTETGRGKGSGASVQQALATLYSVLDGKIIRITSFPSESDALDALGL